MDINIQMLKKNATNDGWDNIYPTTKTSSVINELSTVCNGKDANGIFTTVTFNRKDGTKYMTSVLSGGLSPNYPTRTETYYAGDGITVNQTKIYTRTYDGDGSLTSEVLN